MTISKEKETKKQEFRSTIKNRVKSLWKYRRYHFKRLVNVIPSLILCIRFPFLYPRNRFTDLHYNYWPIIEYHRKHWKEAFETKTWHDEDGTFHIAEKPTVLKPWLAFKIKFLDWLLKYPMQYIFFWTSRTELDAMEPGWRKAFGMQMMKEIKQSLLRNGGRKALRKFRITQIKEKFGCLHFYADFVPYETYKIISKYEYISSRTCIVCGKPAVYQTQGWICPYCEEHVPEREKGDALVFREDIDWYGEKEYINSDTDSNDNS